VAPQAIPAAAVVAEGTRVRGSPALLEPFPAALTVMHLCQHCSAARVVAEGDLKPPATSSAHLAVVAAGF